MRYYSKTGDSGSTSYGRGVRLSKADARIEFTGALDEAQATLGFAAAWANEEGHRLATKSDALSVAEYDQASPAVAKFKEQSTRLDEIYHCLVWMQRAIMHGGMVAMNLANETLAEEWSWDGQLCEVEKQCELFAPQKVLTSFVLPGGSELAARIELVRTTIRRLERVYCQAYSEDEHAGLDALPFFNRLSSLCFILARYSNEVLEVPELSL